MKNFLSCVVLAQKGKVDKHLERISQYKKFYAEFIQGGMPIPKKKLPTVE